MGELIFYCLVILYSNFCLAQSFISEQEVDSSIYIFQRNSIMRFSLFEKDFLNTPIFSPSYKNQLVKYLEKNPYDLDSLLQLYQVQEYLHDIEENKNTLARYKATIDKILSKNPNDKDGLLHASEYNRIKNDKFLRMNWLDTALKYYPNELKVKLFYLDYCIENQNYEQVKLLCNQILEIETQNFKAMFNLVILNFYENVYYGIKNDYALIDNLIIKNPNLKALSILKTYLITLSYILQLTDFGFGSEILYKDWHLPLSLKSTSDSLYNTWNNILSQISNQAVGHSILLLLKFFEKDTLHAKIHFNKAIEFDPYFLPAYYNYYQFQFELGNYKECIKSIFELIKRYPSTQNQLLLAKAYFFSKNYFHAEEILKKLLLEKKSDFLPVYIALAQYYLKFRKMNEVEKYLNLSRQIDSKDPDYNFTAAMYHILLQNNLKAKDHLFYFLEFNEKDAKAWDWLKRL